MIVYFHDHKKLVMSEQFLLATKVAVVCHCYTENPLREMVRVAARVYKVFNHNDNHSLILTKVYLKGNKQPIVSFRTQILDGSTYWTI